MRRRTILTPELVQQAVKMLKEGKTKKTILRELKISPATSGRIQQAMNGIHRPDNANIRRLMGTTPEARGKDTHRLTDTLLDATKALTNFKATLDDFESRLIEVDDFLTEIRRKAVEINNIL